MDAAAAVDEIDLFAHLEILWRHRRSLLGLILAAIAAAAILSWWVIPPTYEASSLVQVGNVQPNLSLGSPETYRSILLSGPVLSRAGRTSGVEARIARGELSDVLVVAPFKAEREPVAPRKALNVAIAGFLALMIGVFGVFAVEAWRARQGVVG